MIDNFQLASWKIWSCKGALCNGNKKNCSWDYIGSIAGLYGVFDLFHSNRPIRRTWYYASPCCYRWIYCIRAGQAKRKINPSWYFTYFRKFNNCYSWLSNSSQTLENTKFVASELSLTLSLVLYSLIGFHEP